MKLPEVTVTYEYKVQESKRKISNIEKLIQDNFYTDEDIRYYFEVFENKDVVVFAELMGYERDEDEIKNGDRRIFQIETLVYIKCPEDLTYGGKAFLRGDNNGWDKAQELLSNVPVWTSGELERAGVSIYGDAGVGFPDKYKYDWEYSLTHKRR